MNTQALIIGLAIIAIVVIVAAVWMMRRRDHLRRRFGPEYERTVRETGSTTKAESTLAQRERRVEKLHIRALTPDESARFSEAWRRVQSRFVDEPKSALNEADRLITEVMAARGYPMSDWNQRVADISVDHPAVLDHYRTGHDIVLKQEQGQATTEDLRRAMVEYRSLFADLVDTHVRDQQRRAG